MRISDWSSDVCSSDLATLQYAFDDFVAVERFAGFVQDVGNDISDGSFAVAPGVECVNASANKYKTAVFDEFVVNRLGRNVFSFEVTLFNCFCNVRDRKSVVSGKIVSVGVDLGGGRNLKK